MATSTENETRETFELDYAYSRDNLLPGDFLGIEEVRKRAEWLISSGGDPANPKYGPGEVVLAFLPTEVQANSVIRVGVRTTALCALSDCVPVERIEMVDTVRGKTSVRYQMTDEAFQMKQDDLDERTAELPLILQKVIEALS